MQGINVFQTETRELQVAIRSIKLTSIPDSCVLWTAEGKKKRSLDANAFSYWLGILETISKVLIVLKNRVVQR